jgi:hypothetical protein
MPDNYLADDETPKVVGGRLTKPYPIRTKGDVNRARVLPPPIDERPAAKKAAPKAAAPAAPDKEQGNSAFDYVVKRNRMLKGVRGPARRGGPRTSRA